MNKKVKFFGIIALVAVFGFSMAACGDDDDGGGGTPGGLNGVWVYGSGANQEQVTISNGSFERKVGTILTMKGTCVINGRSATESLSFTITHLHGDYLKQQSGNAFDSKWYSRSDLKGSGNPDSLLDRVFISFQGTYDGTTMTITIDGVTNSYTKQSGGGGGGGGSAALVGKWYPDQQVANMGLEMAVIYTFSSDGKFTYGYLQEYVGVNYTATNNTISIYSSVDGELSETASYSISGTKLTITNVQNINNSNFTYLENGTYYKPSR
jgi:hypothetical protein